MAVQGSVNAEQAETLQLELQRCVRARVGRRVSGLRIETDNGCCILHGHAPSYHVKQLAQAAVLQKFCFLELRNQIVVGSNNPEGETQCWY